MQASKAGERQAREMGGQRVSEVCGPVSAAAAAAAAAAATVAAAAAAAVVVGIG
jgi:hypothetical protein